FELDGVTNDGLVIPTVAGLTLTGGFTFDFFSLNTGVVANTYTLLSAPAGSALNTFTYNLGLAPTGFNYTILKSDTLVQLQAIAFVPRYWTGDQSGSWSTNNAG